LSIEKPADDSKNSIQEQAKPSEEAKPAVIAPESKSPFLF